MRVMEKQEEDKCTKKVSVMNFKKNRMVLKGGNDHNTHSVERMAKNLWRDGVKDVS